jgi:predicted transcriptional regulator
MAVSDECLEIHLQISEKGILALEWNVRFRKTNSYIDNLFDNGLRKINRDKGPYYSYLGEKVWYYDPEKDSLQFQIL